MVYTVTEKQYELGMMVSNKRYTQAREEGRNANRYSGSKTKETKITQDHQGAISEVVVANFLGLEDFVPSHENKITTKPDIPPFVEVRSRIYNPNQSNSLLIRPSSEENRFERPFVLVLFHTKDFSSASKIRYEICGYLKGWDAMKIKDKRLLKGDEDEGTQDAYLINIRHLKPMSDLIEAYDTLREKGIV